MTSVPPTLPIQLRLDAADASGLDGAARDRVDVAQGVGEIHVAADVVERDGEQFGHRLDGVTENRGRRDDVVGVARVAGRAAPAELVLVGVARPHPDVERLEHPHVAHVTADARGDGGEVVGEARVDAAAEQAHAAGLRGFVQFLAGGLAVGAAGDERRRAEHVDPGAQELRQVRRVRVQRHVQHAVGRREQ